MTNQLLFGETMELIKQKEDWLKIRSMYDGYEGWIRSNQIEEIEPVLARARNDCVAADLTNTLLINETRLMIPAGSSLLGFENGEGSFGNMYYQFKGKDFCRPDIVPDEDLVQGLTNQWLNVPYLWGGRTVFGVDCSGFAQVIFKLLGIDLKRDAWMQAEQGERIMVLQDARCGDLAFFDDKEEIVHVGILLNNSEIIHASGKVRIDLIDKKGIVHSDSGKRTHKLKTIRRYF